MSPIHGLSEQKRLPRLGKIRLGIKKISPRTGASYPTATDYFVCPPEVQAIYGEKPQRLDVIIPVEDEEMWASQYYRQYSRTRGLICKGDGESCRRMVDTETGAIANRDTKEVTWREGCECLGRDCPDYKGKACQEVMNLQALLPKVPGLGIWQIDTGSINSIRNINNCATMIRAMCGRVSWIPLVLTLEPTDVVNPDDGKKKTVYCMHLRYERSAESLLVDSERPRLQLLVSNPLDNEAPDDRELSIHTPEKTEEVRAKAKDDIAELYGGAESELSPESTQGTGKVVEQVESSIHTTGVDILWLTDEMKRIKWAMPTFISWLNSKANYNGLDKSGSLKDITTRMNSEQRSFLVKEINDRLSMK